MLRSRSLRQNSLVQQPGQASAALLPTLELSPEKPNGSRRVSLTRGLPTVVTRSSWSNRSYRRLFICFLSCVLIACCYLLLNYFEIIPTFRSGGVLSGSTRYVSRPPAHLKQKAQATQLRSLPIDNLAQHAFAPQKPVDPVVIKPERAKATKDLSRWPPMITAVPEVPPSADATLIGVTNEGIDSQFCSGGPRCRMLLPLWIGEQESRGRMHLTQLVQLASSLNRTLVLPNVGKSRLGTCGKWSFEAYYDTGSIARQLKEVGGGTGRVMLMDDFRTWLNMRPDHPQGQLLFFQEDLSLTPDAHLLASVDGLSLFVDHKPLELTDRRLKNSYCLKTKYRGLALDGYHSLSMYLTVQDPAVTASGELLADLLKKPDTVQKSMPRSPSDIFESSHQPSPLEPEVLVVHWDLRHMPFMPPTPLPALNYSQMLWSMSHRLTSAHGPYLTVHWRMETVEPFMLPDCAEALVDTLSTLLADPTLADGVRTVWLATDVPWSGSTATEDTLAPSPAQRSNTFKAFTDEHFEAIGILKTAFGSDGPLSEWKLTGLGEEVQRLRRENKPDELVLAHEDDMGVLWEDSGIWGILDKIVAMQSALFVSGARGCGRVSSFTKQIVDFRAEQRGESAPRNVVELFG